MNLKRARYIITIYEEGGFTAAAKKLFVSQPSLSQTVRQEEEEMGVEIFERGTKPLKLTFAGEKYIEAAKIMIMAEENLEGLFDEINHQNRGRLKVGVSLQRGMQLLPMVLPEFIRLYPDVELQFEEKGSEKLEKMVAEGQIDLAFATTEPSNNNLKYILIESESFGLLTGSNNRLTTIYKPGEEIDLRDAENEIFISLKHGHNIRWIQDKFFAKYGISPTIIAETDSVEAAIRITAACNFCMLCPHVFVRNNSALANKSVYYRIKGEEIARHFYACYRKDRFFPAYMNTFIKLAHKASAESCLNQIGGASGA